MNKRRKLSPEEIMDNLSEALYEAATENEESLNEELQFSGYDPDEVSKEGEVFVQRLKGQVRLEKARQSRRRLLEFVIQIRNSLSSESDPKNQIATWLRGEFGLDVSGHALQTLYHKLETVDEEDMESLAQDAELLRMWERIESEADEREQSE